MSTVAGLTLAEKQAIKADAAKRFDGRVHEIVLGEPVLRRVVLAPFDRTSYGEFVDAEERDRTTAVDSVLITRSLYPGLVEIDKLRREWPAAADDIVMDMERRAGVVGASEVSIRQFDGPALLAEAERIEDPKAKDIFLAKAMPAGLDPGRIGELVEGAKGMRLWSCEIPLFDLSVIMISPVAQIWRAAKTAELDARAKKKGIIASTEDYVLPAVVWEKTPLVANGNGLLDDRPALYWWLWNTFLRMGGAGVRLRSGTF